MNLQPKILVLMTSILLWLPGLTLAQEKTYIGSEQCMACHDEVYNYYKESAHYKTDLDEKAPAELKGCEACHGPGSEHMEDPEKALFKFPGKSAKSRSEICLKCHKKEAERFTFRKSEHRLGAIACDDCHLPPHNAPAKEYMLRETAPNLCYNCHREIMAEFALPEHHKVPEGVINCTDCHTPHGSPNYRMLKKEADEVCFKCHTDKRGPWIYEHLSLYVEGCLVCHKPHGSNSRHLLTYQEVRMLCLSCHPDAPAFHNQRNARFQTCTVCHMNIHGSNVSKILLE